MWTNGKWFVALTLSMMVGAIPIISFPPIGFYGIALAAVLTGVPQWGFLRRHQVSALWLASTLAILPILWGSMWVARLLTVPLFYSDPISFNHPGQHFRPIWTWGWWTIGMGLAGGLLGAIQLPLLWTRWARAWCWPLVGGVAWACLGAAKTWPWQGQLLVSMVVGPMVWATVEWMGLGLLGKRLVGAAGAAPIGVAEQ